VLITIAPATDKWSTPKVATCPFRAQLADVLAQVLLVAGRHDGDLTAEVARKWLVWKPWQ
jgi:NTP pyrophosphatase (non-canonical NTP hydrolase)